MTAATSVEDIPDISLQLANEMNQLSVQEREQIYEEIHAIEQKVIQESPEMIAEALSKLQEEIDHLLSQEQWRTRNYMPQQYGQQQQQRPSSSNHHNNLTAYQYALQTNPSYINDPKFRLQFLRANRFDAAGAATQMMNFMEEKEALFGRDLVSRPIYYQDLSEKDQAIMQKGYLQVLCSRDRAGRPIVADFGMVQHDELLDNALKLFFYHLQCIAADEETQKRGYIGFMYYVDFALSANIATRQMPRQAPRLLYWFPLRCSGIHVCGNDPKIYAFKTLIGLAMGLQNRLHLRIHSGSHTECQYSAMAFGIPLHAFPFSSIGGELKTNYYQKWLGRRIALDKKMAKPSQNKQQSQYYHITDLLGIYDVLLGRGKTSNEHDGNVRLRMLVNEYMDAYDNALTGQKHLIARHIIQYIQNIKGGRFFKRDKSGWLVVVEDEEAVNKVTQMFRTVRSMQLKSSKSSTCRSVGTIRGTTNQTPHNTEDTVLPSHPRKLLQHQYNQQQSHPQLKEDSFCNAGSMFGICGGGNGNEALAVQRI